MINICTPLPHFNEYESWITTVVTLHQHVLQSKETTVECQKEIGKEGRGEGQVQLTASLNVPEQYQRGFSTLAVDQNTK